MRDGRETTDMAMNWLSTNLPDSRFFLWVHYFEPHVPFDLQDYSVEVFASRGYAGNPIDQLRKETAGATKKEKGKRLRNSPEYIEAMRILYDGEVRATDRFVTELLAFMDDRDLLANTVVIVTGDHGEGLGEHGRWHHGPVLFNSALHVPLIIRDFRRTTASRVGDLVGLVDIAPTLLESAGLPIPVNLQGRSLVPAINGEKLETRPYFSEINKKKGPAEKRLAVFVDRFKLIVSGDRLSLFDLSEDPEELHSLPIEDFEPIVRQLGDVAEEFLAHNEESLESPLQEEDIKELRALGYL